MTDEGIFYTWFSVLSNGNVIVSQKLDRSKAAVLTLPVSVIDTSAPTLQQAEGRPNFVFLCYLYFKFAIGTILHCLDLCIIKNHI